MKKILAVILTAIFLVLPVTAVCGAARSPEVTQKSNVEGTVNPKANEKTNSSGATATPKTNEKTNIAGVTASPKANTKSNIADTAALLKAKTNISGATATPKANEKTNIAGVTASPKANTKSNAADTAALRKAKTNISGATATPKANEKTNISAATATPKANLKTNAPKTTTAPETKEKSNLPGIPENNAVSALLMEKETGTVLYEKNAHEKLEPASVTKVMTMLLVAEAIENGLISRQDMVTVSAHGASMGGSQVFLEEGEQMSVNDLLKAVAVASGNDAAVTLAEAVAGSEEAFAIRMNERAKELGMNDTHFENCTGLPAEGHVTSAYDIAVMSRELLKCPFIKEYTTIWMDSLRNGSFGLSNTNKLVRFYKGATGLKTGSTDTARFCLSATAERDGMELIATVLKAPTSNERFETAKNLLNFGFANYQVVDVYPERALAPVDVLLGVKTEVQPVLAKSSRILVKKTEAKSVTQQTTVSENVEAPVEKGQKLGEMVVSVNGEVRETIPVVASEGIPRLTIGGLFKRMTELLFMKEK